MSHNKPIQVKHLFKPLDDKLIELLESLSEADWQKPTVAKRWQVKDIVSHLLDGNIRTLSIQRDRYFGDVPPVMHSYTDLVGWLNELNADWTKATKRISPRVLILLHQVTGNLVSQYYESLAPDEPAIFPVAWAGESQSLNWMHLAREYSEKWHHQQQIREAVGKEGILTKEFFRPCMDTYFRALPFTFREVKAAEGTLVKITISTPVGGEWFLQKHSEGWHLINPSPDSPEASVEMHPAVARKLFSKNIRPAEVADLVKITGNTRLGQHVLTMVSVMA